MQFVNDPQKSKRVFILMLILVILFFLSAGAMGFLYYKKVLAYRKLVTETQSSQEKIKNLETQIAGLEKEKADLQTEKTNLENQITEKNTKSEKIKTYTAVISYISNLIKSHNGLDGWTEAEYQRGMELVRATGDSNLEKTSEWAWVHQELSQMARLAAVFDAVVKGINSNL